ncbi:hypothetical protein [Staphylococcus equorum]|uniref:hypothetical protein n=1 Tax=Staphylococcus equorum TaxID=246432 RepID=UPI00192D0F6B|nr:hypothetical protein [Staphylococcus equorum]
MVRYADMDEVTNNELNLVKELTGYDSVGLHDDLIIFDSFADIMDWINSDADYSDYRIIINESINTGKTAKAVILNIYDIGRLGQKYFKAF